MSSTTTTTIVDTSNEQRSTHDADHSPSQVGASIDRQSMDISAPQSRMSFESFEVTSPGTGAQTPDVLLKPGFARSDTYEQDISDVARELERISTQQTNTAHMGTVMENLARSSKIPNQCLPTPFLTTSSVQYKPRILRAPTNP
jgi:hypothetical protein